MNSLLITGSTGMLGGELMKRAPRNRDTRGACHRTPRPGFLQLDFNLPARAKAAIIDGNFSHIIHCAAIRDPDYCLAHPDETDITNVRGSELVAEAAQRLGAVLLYISTDYVFDGKHPPYSESAKPCPINAYGRSKLAGEKAARSVAEHVVVRIPALYQSTLGNPANVLTRFAGALAEGKILALDSETVRHYTRAEDVADAVLFLLESDYRGIVHVSSDEALSKAQFARLAAVQLGYAPDRVTDAPPPDSGDARPHNSKLDTTLYRSMHGPRILPAREAISLNLERSMSSRPAISTTPTSTRPSPRRTIPAGPC